MSYIRILLICLYNLKLKQHEYYFGKVAFFISVPSIRRNDRLKLFYYSMTLKRDSEVYRESCIPSSHYLKRNSGEFSRA